MRVIAGTKGGQILYAPETNQIRPIQDKVKAALFNIWRNLVSNSNFLDLFAGTGSVGIEALSRGAEHATFVDKSPQAIRLVRKNLDKLGLIERSHLYQKDVLEAISTLERRGKVYDLIFVGPPYGEGLADETLHKLAEAEVLRKWGVAAAEISNKDQLQESYGQLVLIDERCYGGNVLRFYRRKPRE